MQVSEIHLHDGAGTKRHTLGTELQTGERSGRNLEDHRFAFVIFEMHKAVSVAHQARGDRYVGWQWFVGKGRAKETTGGTTQHSEAAQHVLSSLSQLQI
jgi:hypothetical protein